MFKMLPLYQKKKKKRAIRISDFKTLETLLWTTFWNMEKLVSSTV